MEIKEYKNLEEAIRNILFMKDDQEHILVRHSLQEGEKIGKHFHPKVDEYLILNDGRIKATLSGESRDIDAKGKTLVIKFPKEHYHGLEALSWIRYLVLRTGDDEIIYR